LTFGASDSLSLSESFKVNYIESRDEIELRKELPDGTARALVVGPDGHRYIKRVDGVWSVISYL